MLSTMIQKDPQARKTANEHLCEQVLMYINAIFSRKNHELKTEHIVKCEKPHRTIL